MDQDKACHSVSLQANASDLFCPYTSHGKPSTFVMEMRLSCIERQDLPFRVGSFPHACLLGSRCFVMSESHMHKNAFVAEVGTVIAVSVPFVYL